MQFLNSFKISTKMGLLFALSALSLAALIAIGGWLQYQRMFDDRINKLKAVVEAAHGVASTLEGEIKEGKINKEQAQERFRHAAHAMRYNEGKDYLVAFSMEGVTVANSNSPKSVGNNSLGTKDVNDKPIVGSMVDLMK